MEWLLTVFLSVFSENKKGYEKKVEGLRSVLDKFENGTVPLI